MNTEIKGHLQVTRSLTVGGRTHIEGPARIGGNLKVDGWLDVRHLKVPCKGLFADAVTLAERYPNPLPGWWALVGNSIPAEIYRSDGVNWVATGQYGGEITIDLNHYDDAIDAANDAIGDAVDEISRLSSEVAAIVHPVAVSDDDDPDNTSDLDIADDEGNVLVRFADGHIRTMYFDSANIDTDHPVDVATPDSSDSSDLDITDPQGNVLARFADGHIRTKCFNSADINQFITDTVTGRKYEITVTDGVLGCKPAGVNILVLGNSFTRHPLYASYGWNCVRGMAATVAANDYVSLLAEGTGGHVEVAHIGSEVACVDFERNYSVGYDFGRIVFDTTIKYDVVIVELFENASYSSSMQQAWTNLYRYFHNLYPEAMMLQLVGWDNAQKRAAIQAACDACGVTLLNNHDLTYTGQLAGGQYITDDDPTAVSKITSTIITHPSDVGMLLTANRILDVLGYQELGYLHDITIITTSGGTVATFNGYNRGVYRSLITLNVTPASGRSLSSLSVTAGAHTIAVTRREEGLYTFLMPNAPVTINATFN